MNAERFAEQTLKRRRIAVCVGCGGVGKTTVAAALAIEAARRHQRALVMTIDPARRLADALGVGALGNEPQSLTDEAREKLGVPADGSVSAMMLDMKRTFDDLVERFAESPEARDRILGNPIYQHASDALAGSVEYSAMEKVFELYERKDFDLIVVDTPPAQHALDFLEAPQRLLEFLDSRIVQMLIHPAFAAGRFGFKIFHRGTKRALRVMEKITGLGFLEDVSEFLLAFEGMSEGFRQRASRVRALLLGPESSFVLVAGAGRESAEQAVEFRDRLQATGVVLAGILVNRIRLWPGRGGVPDLDGLGDAHLDALAEALGAGEGSEFPAHEAARAALEAAKGYARLVRRDADAIQELRERVQRDEPRAPGKSGDQGIENTERFFACIPELNSDVHDLAGLAHIADTIFARQSQETPL